MGEVVVDGLRPDQNGETREKEAGAGMVCASHHQEEEGKSSRPPADLTNAGAVPNRLNARCKRTLAISRGFSGGWGVGVRTAMRNDAGATHQSRAADRSLGIFRGERCGRPSGQTISANTAPTATMAMTVAIRALGRVSIMRGF